jgi:CRISPR/Cas system CSM-associated protein Csm3 (group 7 of RAMP superfamily)
MRKFTIKFILLSDACFSRGDGTVGEVDIEVEHDRYGLPYLNGRALKGLLHEEAAELVNALSLSGSTSQNWNQIANRVFGEPGSSQETQGLVHFGNATLPPDFRKKITDHELNAHDVLLRLTSTRTQTSNDDTGAPKPETLRVMRIIPRGTPFQAELICDDGIEELDLAFLSACIKALRRAGSNKSRGMGKIQTRFDHFTIFEEAI